MKYVDTKPLTWDKTLANHAKQYAAALGSQGCLLTHSNYPGEGENLYAAWGNSHDGNLIQTDAVKGWYDEVENFNFNDLNSNLQHFHDIGHFTQLIWRNTQKVGCASSPCTQGGMAGIIAVKNG